MYYKYQTLEEVIKHLEEYKTETRAKIDAWKSVEIKKKKNGEEFARLSQALVNAKTGQYYPVEDATHPYLTVTFKHGYKWISDQLEAFYYMDTLTEEQRKDRYVIPHESWSRATSPMTADELRRHILWYIERLEEHEKSLEKQIECAPEMFKAYRSAIEKAEKDLETAVKQFGNHHSLYYAIISTR